MFTRIGFVCCYWLTFAAMVPAAEPPKIEELIAKMPVLSPDNEAVKSCELRADVGSLGPYHLRSQIGWDRAQGQTAQGFVLYDPQRDVPISVMARGTGFLYDVIGQRGMLGDGIWPRFQLGASEKGNFKISVGMATQQDFDNSRDLVAIDVASLLRGCEEVRWAEVLNGFWMMHAQSKNGRTKIACGFQPDHDYPLKSCLVYADDPSQPLIKIEVVAVNQPVDPQLLSFPADDRIPRNYPILEFAQLMENDPMTAGLIGFNALFALHAMREPKARKDLPLIKVEDWGPVERHYAEVAPALKRLAPAKPQDP